MTRKRFAILTVSVLALIGLACNDGDILSTGGTDPSPGVSPTPDPNQIPDTNPDPNGDIDGDGIPDGEDNLPCMAIYLRVANQGVSSAEVLINDELILEASSFPTEEVIVQFINPNPGINYLELGGKLQGSPDDILHFLIANTDGTIYLDESVTRDNGTPQAVVLEFVVDADCS